MASAKSKLITGLTITILLLAGLFYYNAKSKGNKKKSDSELTTSKSADSVLIEKLSNTDTITSLQDPIDTTQQKIPK